MNSFENIVRRFLGHKPKSVEVKLRDGIEPSQKDLPSERLVHSTPQLERDIIVPGEKLSSGEYAPHHYPTRADQKKRAVDRAEVGENPNPQHVEVTRDDESGNVAYLNQK